MNPIGLEVGGRRNRAARSLFLATKKRANEIPRSSPNHHKKLARWNTGLSLPPISSVCSRAHRSTRRMHAQLGVRRTAQSGGSRADGPLFRRLCSGRRRRFWFLPRSSLVASLMATVTSLMATVSPRLAAVHPVGPGGVGGRGGGRGGLLCFGLQRLSADDSVKPKAAPSPSRESAFRREIISVLISWFISGLRVTHACRTGLAVG